MIKSVKLKVPFTHLTILFCIFDRISVFAGATFDAGTTEPAGFYPLVYGAAGAGGA